MLFIQDEITLTHTINYVKEHDLEENKRYLSNISKKYIKNKDIDSINFLLRFFKNNNLVLFHFFAEEIQNSFVTFSHKEDFYILYFIPLFFLEVTAKKSTIFNPDKEIISNLVDNFIEKNNFKSLLNFEYFHTAEFVSYNDLFYKDNIFYIPDLLKSLIYNTNIFPKIVKLDKEPKDFVLFLPIFFKFKKQDVFVNNKFLEFNKTLNDIKDSTPLGIKTYLEKYFQENKIEYNALSEMRPLKYSLNNFTDKINKHFDNLNLRVKFDSVLEELNFNVNELKCEIVFNYKDNLIEIVFFNKNDKFHYPRLIIQLNIFNREHAESNLKNIKDLLNERNIPFEYKTS